MTAMMTEQLRLEFDANSAGIVVNIYENKLSANRLLISKEKNTGRRLALLKKRKKLLVDYAISQLFYKEYSTKLDDASARSYLSMPQ